MNVVMNKSIFCATALIALMGIGAHFSANRMAQCAQKGGIEAACVASEWDMEKVNPLPQYNPDNGAIEPGSDTVYSVALSGH